MVLTLACVLALAVALIARIASFRLDPVGDAAFAVAAIAALLFVLSSADIQAAGGNAWLLLLAGTVAAASTIVGSGSPRWWVRGGGIGCIMACLLSLTEGISSLGSHEESIAFSTAMQMFWTGSCLLTACCASKQYYDWKCTLMTAPLVVLPSSVMQFSAKNEVNCHLNNLICL